MLSLNMPGLICLHTIKWFQVLLFDTNNSCQHYNYALLTSGKIYGDHVFFL